MTWLWTVPSDAYSAFVQTGTFALGPRGRARLAEVAPGDRVFAYLSGRQVVAGQFEVVGDPFEDPTALVPGRHLPHRVRVRPVAVLPEEVWVPRESLDGLRVLDEYGDLPPADRFRRVVSQGVHRLPPIDGTVLAFLLQARLGADPEVLMDAVDAVRRARTDAAQHAAPSLEPTVAEPAAAYDADWERAAALDRLAAAVRAQGYRFEPWEIAVYVTALRTKPFVLLAGITGVGKSRLPVLVARATGGDVTVLPVRPDWTDPAETMGYRNLQGRFVAGSVLRVAREAETAERSHVVVLDEMNLGRPEHYLADVLSRMEQRTPVPGGYASPPLLSDRLAAEDAQWQPVRLPPALGVVGTVNVDETAHVFSRKVLDRAFVLELVARDLGRWSEAATVPAPEPWPLAAWTPRAVRLGELTDLSDAERQRIGQATKAVSEASEILAPAALGVGYRARDEIALFVLHASETPDAFGTSEGERADPLDLALLAKLVPRVDGARAATREAVDGLLGWAVDGRVGDARRVRAQVERWLDAGRPAAISGARFPRTAARLARIADDAQADGVVTFWS